MSGVLDPSSMPAKTAASLIKSANTTLSNTSGTSLLPSSPRELLSLPLRALHHAEKFAFSTAPRHIARMVGMNDVTLNLWPTTAPVAGESAVVHEAMAAASDIAAGVPEAVAAGDGWYIGEFMQTMRKVGGFFGYLTSIWSFACLVEALILNRITIYASTRRHLRFGWERRLAIRLIPIVLLSMQILALLRGIRCQTSPNYPEIRYGKPREPLIFDYATGGGSLHWIISNLLSWETDEQACSAVKMGRGDTNTNLPHGTFAFLWPTFLILCGSCFVETLACALQGRAVKTETGMTLFEHSLAFAEAESMISKSIGLNMFGLPKQNPISQSASGESGTSPLYLLTRAQVLDRMNITPELLLIVVISCCNTLSYHVLDVLGKQNRYRLINTAFWGVLFMAAMCWGLEAGPPVSLDTGVLRFPTVCIVGFIPHMLILFGIIVCFAIYGLALTITAFSLPTEDDGQTLSLRERFFLAHANMQGSQQIQNIRANRHEDFYTTLLRIGYVALTAASEAVFLNEGKAVIARQMTWLEQDRLAEIQASRERSSYGNFSRQDAGGTSFDAHAFTTFDLPDNGSTWESGYNREKTIEKPQGSRALRSQVELGGVGAVQSSIRLRHGISFFRAIFALIARWMAFGFCRVLDRLGISRRPQWLKRLAGSRNSQAPNTSSTHPSNDFWILNDEGDLEVPANGEFDVEYEMRKRDGEYTRETSQGPDENRIDDKLYGWWKSGGSWGNQDYTPDYNPPIDNDDITSVISMATNASQSDWEDCNSDGRRTPTQSNPHPMYSRESSPLQEQSMDVSMLARLLDPRDRETREEARILAAHLKSGQGGRILTRSQYQKQMERDRSRVLLSSRLSDVIDRPVSGNCKPTAEEEAELLEKLILSRRSETVPMPDDNTSWESGASGLGPNGPPCVVCQTNPRSVITWPCRCLCVCEDCRVSLAMNNFGSCVTCRQDVNGFMRLWVP